LTDGIVKSQKLQKPDKGRRIKSIRVDMVAIGDSLMVSGSYQIAVKADHHINDLQNLDAYAGTREKRWILLWNW